jgi:hypothetical protein
METIWTQALELARGKDATASAVMKVAAATSSEAASWAFTQWKLRQKARAKFGLAAEMLFVREALEQATDERLAAFHASRFPAGALVADLTVGIGADLIALARRGPALGFEVDAERAECARHNVGAHGLNAEVREADCLADPWSFELAFADPSRRVEGSRTFDPSQFEPDPQVVAERMSGLKLAGMKLSPMLPDAYLAGLGGSLEFVSLGRECREALVWLGEEAGEGVWAVQVESGARLQGGGGQGPNVDWADRFVYEADPAAIRAHCLDGLCGELGLSGLGDSNGYLTGPKEVGSPWLRGYRTLTICSADERTTKEALNGLSARVTAVKVRGAEVDVEKTARKFRSGGDRKVILMVYCVGNSRKHVIVEPLH